MEIRNTPISLTTNLYEETAKALRDNGKTWSDINYCTLPDLEGELIVMQATVFKRVSVQIDYFTAINPGLTLHGSGWVMRRILGIRGIDWWDFAKTSVRNDDYYKNLIYP